MVSSNLGSTDLTDLSTGHTDGPFGHDVINDWLDIATRPASTLATTHSSAGALAVDVNLAAGGHTRLITVSANITSITFSNVTDGVPFNIIFLGNGSSAFTINMSNIKVNQNTSLNSAVAIGPSDVLMVSLLRLPSGAYWAPGGLIVYNNIGGASGITNLANASFLYNGSSVTSIAVPIPSGVVAGDFIELVVQTQESVDVGAANTPSGWTSRFSGGHTAAFMPRITKFYKFASGSEGGTNQTVTFPTSCRPCGGTQVWRGVNASTPYDNSASAVVTGSGNVDPNAVTAVNATAVATVWAAGNKTGGVSCTAPAGYTKTIDQSSSDRSIVAAYKQLSSTGSENPAAFGWAVDNMSVFTDILRAA